MRPAPTPTRCVVAAVRALSRIMLLAIALLPSAAAQGVDFAGSIAYVTPFGQLAVVDPSRGEPRLLGPVGTRYRFPAFAPDGERIAAIGAVGTQGVVSVFDGDGSRHVYRSEAEPPIYAYWSPDGNSLSFIAAKSESGLGLHVADAVSRPRLVATGSPFYWAWEEDGESLLAHVGFTGEGSRLAFADPERGIAEADLDPPGFFQAPGISPSGQYVAYATVAAGGERRVVVASHPFVAGEVVRRELAHQGFAMLSWSPTADVLAVMAPTLPASHWFGPIRLLDAESGLLEPLVEGVSLAFFWSPDGTKLASLHPVPTPDVQQVADRTDADPTSAGRMAADRVVTDRGTADRGAADRTTLATPPDLVEPLRLQASPLRLRLQVTHLAGVDRGRVQTLATFTPSASFVNEFLPFFDQYALSHRIWSPSSDALAVPVLGRDGVTRVLVVGLDGSLREIAAGDMPFWNVR